jgi:peptide/nickel transport system permease protein
LPDRVRWNGDDGSAGAGAGRPGMSDIVFPFRGVRLRRRLAMGRLTQIGLILLGLVVLFTLVGPLVYHASPNHTNPFDVLKPPSRQFPLGTDALGRDTLARLIHAGLLSIPAGMAAVGIGAIVGSFAGIVSGFVGGATDNVFMRVIDIMLTFPTLLTALFVVAILGPGIGPAIAAVSIAAFPSYARVLRGSVLSLRNAAFIDAARVSNTPLHRMVVRHVLPNVFDVLLVLVVIGIGNGIVVLASLSFLGIGVQPPQADWGVMLADGVKTITISPIGVLAPAVVLVITVIGINLLGEGLGAALRVDTLRARRGSNR